MGSEYTRALEESYLGDAEQSAEWQRAQKNLLKIVEHAHAMSASVGLVVFPILVELDGSYPFKNICDELMRFAEENDIPAHNLLDAFMGRHAPDLWVSAYTQHANEEGHAIVAEVLYPFLDRLIQDKLRTESPTGG